MLTRDKEYSLLVPLSRAIRVKVKGQRSKVTAKDATMPKSFLAVCCLHSEGKGGEDEDEDRPVL